jgi:hypothetical protein
MFCIDFMTWYVTELIVACRVGKSPKGSMRLMRHIFCGVAPPHTLQISVVQGQANVRPSSHEQPHFAIAASAPCNGWRLNTS